jgi:hypothetical protein
MYMIVGLQVAKSAKVYHLLGNTQGGGAKGGAPIGTTGVDIAGHLDVTKNSEMSDALHVKSKFVFSCRIRACIHISESPDGGNSREWMIVFQEYHLK